MTDVELPPVVPATGSVMRRVREHVDANREKWRDGVLHRKEQERKMLTELVVEIAKYATTEVWDVERSDTLRIQDSPLVMRICFIRKTPELYRMLLDMLATDGFVLDRLVLQMRTLERDVVVPLPGEDLAERSKAEAKIRSPVADPEVPGPDDDAMNLDESPVSGTTSQ